MKRKVNYQGNLVGYLCKGAERIPDSIFVNMLCVFGGLIAGLLIAVAVAVIY